MSIKTDIQKIFDLAVANISASKIKSAMGSGKSFELRVLATILSELKSTGYQVNAVPPPGRTAHNLYFAGSPASANKKRYTYFVLVKPNSNERFEAWVSVQFQTLSAQIALPAPTPTPPRGWKCAKHELDIGIYKAPTPPLPSYLDVVFGASCKDSGATKAHIREALGLRRELGTLGNTPQAPILYQHQPSRVSPTTFMPPSILRYYSSDTLAGTYSYPVNALGVEARYLKHR